MTKALFLAIGNRSVASSRARVYSYLPYLRKEGFKVFALHYTPSWQCKKILSVKKQNIFEKAASKVYSAIAILILLILAPFFDVVFIQKVILSRFTISVLKALNRNIIFDFDDSIFLYKDISYTLKKSARVIVSNRYLKDFSEKYNEKVYELPSPVETDNIAGRKLNGQVVIGWAGSAQTSKYLFLLTPVFNALKGRFKNLIIEAVGIENCADFNGQFDIKTVKWSVEKCKRHFENVHIGIMPLLDDEWSRGKAGYKLLQYMSYGIPCVASPVGINKNIITDGVNGFLAAGNDEWLQKLSLLITDASLRQRMGQEGFRSVDSFYSYRVAAPRLVEILGETNVG